MILVDTSVWIDHLRQNDEQLVGLLNAGKVLGHPFVTGEIALGNLRNRDAILAGLGDLPSSVVATNQEVMIFIGKNMLYGQGIGFVDAHLLASVLLTPGAKLWTRDRRLLAAAASIGIAEGVLH